MFGLVPFGSRRDLSRDDGFKSLFDVFNEPFFHDDFMPAFRQAGGMKVDVRDLGDAFELTADLPGMKKEDIRLGYENNYLTISAEQQESKEDKDDKGSYIRRERHYGSVSRSFYIDGIDETKVSAEFKDGVLRVNLPKAQVTQVSKQIEIK